MTVRLSPEKVAAARIFDEWLAPGMRVCVTTHVNPDGDGLGSEVGLVHLLRARGLHAIVTNPSPTPERFKFLFDDLPDGDQSRSAVRELRRAEAVIVLDIADLERLGSLARPVAELGVPVGCIDHHFSPGTLPDGPRYVDPTASATGELVFEIAAANHWTVDQAVALSLIHI